MTTDATASAEGSSPISIFALCETLAEQHAFVGLNTRLAGEIAEQGASWDTEVWNQAIARADARYGDALKGVIHRARTLEAGRFEEMLRSDLSSLRPASAHIAIRAGRFDPELPTLAWVAMEIGYGKTNDGDLGLTRYLLSAGANPNAAHLVGGTERTTPLYLMASRAAPPWAHPEGMRLLLDAGADPRVVCARGDTALHPLCGSEWFDEEIVEVIQRLRAMGADMGLPNDRGETPLSLLQGSSPGEPPESVALRGQLLASFDALSLDDLLPAGAPTAKLDIDGR